MSFRQHRHQTGKLPFPLIRASPFLDRADTVSFTIFRDADNHPTDKTKHYMPIFETGSSEDWLEFRAAFVDLSRKKGFTNEPDQLFWHLGQVLKNDAERKFDTARTQTVDTARSVFIEGGGDIGDFDDATINIFNTTVDKMTRGFMVEHIARDLRKAMFNVRKPYSMTVDDFMSRMYQFNTYLPVMPVYRGFNAPLSDEELLTVLESAMPHYWYQVYIQSGMAAQYQLHDAVDYFKRLEAQEPKESSKDKPNNNNNKKKKKYEGRKIKSSSGGPGGDTGGGNTSSAGNAHDTMLVKNRLPSDGTGMA